MKKKMTIKVAALMSMFNLTVVAAKLQCNHLGHDNLLQTCCYFRGYFITQYILSQNYCYFGTELFIFLV